MITLFLLYRISHVNYLLDTDGNTCRRHADN